MIPPARGLAPLWMAALVLPTPMAQAKVVTIAMCGGAAGRSPCRLMAQSLWMTAMIAVARPVMPAQIGERNPTSI